MISRLGNSPEALPKISVITPSYNQGQFIEQTLLSVIYQGYPNLEYIVMDGGSNDGSADIIRRYEQHLTYWQSKKDLGQSAAINEGFSKATGDILCWLNSDDMLMPGALLKIGRLFNTINKPSIIFGNCLHFHEGKSKTRGSDVAKNHQVLDLDLCDYIIQPSSFWNRSAWEKNGILDEKFYFVFDWEWFIRARKIGIDFVPVPDYLSLYRIHEAHKSGSAGDKRTIEIVKIYDWTRNPKVGKAYQRWISIGSKYPFIHKLVHVSNAYSLNFIGRIMNLILCPQINFKTFQNITRM